MTIKVGTYHFGRHHSSWGIWCYDYVSASITSSRFVKDVWSYEEAVKEVYRLNGWGTPKRIIRKY